MSTDPDRYREQDLRRAVAEDDRQTEQELWDAAWALIKEGHFIGPIPTALSRMYNEVRGYKERPGIQYCTVAAHDLMALLAQRKALMAEIKRLNRVISELSPVSRESGKDT